MNIVLEEPEGSTSIITSKLYLLQERITSFYFCYFVNKEGANAILNIMHNLNTVNKKY